jgi:LuxR family transcriptional regulator, maltose regulon positive regulatory protein
MAKQTLAKYTRPKQVGVLPRERLYTLLDQARQCPLIYVSAPAGAGKTTLLASYAEQRRAACIWYQVDATDADPATLFGNFGESLSKRGVRLPALLEANSDNLAAFTRLFFRQYFSRLPTKFMLVLDAGIDLHAHGTLAKIMADAAQEVPEGCNIVLLSRETPPPQFARLRLQRTLTELSWDELRLQPEETNAIVALSATPQNPALLHEQCGGWVAGLRLLLEHQQRTGGAQRAPLAGGRDALFGYFTAEIFDALPAATQSALLRTCFTPEVSERAARALTRESAAWTHLCELHQRRLFVDFLGADQPVLRYHALFRDFLMIKARATFSPFELKALQRDAAALLVEEGRTDAAVPLLTEAGEWSAASRLILEEANTMLARGHTQTLRSWVAALPSWYVDATPRLLYCLGLAQSTSDPEAGIAALERAYQRFQAQRNPLGQALCAAAIIQAHYFRFDSYLGMRPWADALDELTQQGLSCPSPETELHIYSMLHIALTYIEPGHARLPHIAERVLSLVSRGLDINQTVVAAGMLLTYFDWFAPDRAKLLAGYVQPLLRARELTTFNKIWWLMAEVHHYRCAFELEQCRKLVAQIEELSEQHAVRLSEASIMTLKAGCLDPYSPNPEIEQSLARALRSLNASRRQEEINLRTYAADIYLQRGDITAGLANCERALQVSRDTGLRISEMETLGLLTIALGESGRAEEALHAARAARLVIGGTQAPKLELHHLLIEGYAELRSSHPEAARSLLQRAFVLGREHGFLEGYQWNTHVMALLCAEALNANIETPHVRNVIRSHRLTPPPGVHCATWPWPIRISVLGRFEIQLNGELLSFSSKAPKKSLELLKALIAKGPGGVEQTLIAQDLWADSEGDAAESAVRMALHRLRKLLGSDEAILVQEGKLQINPTLCWVDAWAFEQACRELELGGSAGACEPVQALRLYGGEAFAAETLQAWMLAARDRWRSKFLRVVRIVGAAQESNAGWQQAIETYEAGIRADPLCEEFYQAVMLGLLKQGKTAEAYSAYRRCRDALSITLGVNPSVQTEALRKQIAIQGAA